MMLLAVLLGCGDDAATDGGGLDGGAADGSGSDGAVVDGSASACGIYESLCGGRCVPADDPDNCGGCGVACAGGEVCSVGLCTGECLPGLTPCDRRCVDLAIDNASCGACSTPCATGTGCVDGSCAPSLITLDPPSACDGGGPPLELEVGGEAHCAGTIAENAFRWALCSCSDMQLRTMLETDGYDSMSGPYAPGELGGGVGLNGVYMSSGVSEIGGAFWASSAEGTSPTNDLFVRQELHLGGSFSPQNATIDEDAFVMGDVDTPGTVVIGGDLHQPPGSIVSGDVTFANLIEEDVSVLPPCDCAPVDLVPITAIVAARQAANDNASIGLDPAALTNPTGPLRVDLPCGHFYVDAITGAHPIAIVAHGHVALYVGGDVAVQSALHVAVDPGGTLDVFIGGDLTVTGVTGIGSPAHPALSRFYVAGDGGLTIFDGARLAAFFYAPFGLVGASGPLEVFGGIFAGELETAADVRVHYDRAVLTVGDDCDIPGGTCSSCRDCNGRACVSGACAACTDSSQCCAPLVCVDGACLAAPN